MARVLDSYVCTHERVLQIQAFERIRYREPDVLSNASRGFRNSGDSTL
jgi:hypothetical protein